MSILSALTFDTKRITNEGLRRLNLVIGAVYLIEAVVILVLSNLSAGVPVVTNYLASDKLASVQQGRDVFATASKSLFSLDLAYVVAAFLVVSAVIHLLSATRNKKRYEADLKTGSNSLRWTGYGVSLGLIFVVVSLLLGISDLALLLAVIGSVVISMLSTRTGETGDKKNGWAGSWVSWLAIAVVLVADLIYLKGGLVYGDSRGAYIYFLVVVAGVYLIWLNQLIFQYKRIGFLKDYMKVERAYMLSGLIAQSAIAWITFAGFLNK